MLEQSKSINVYGPRCSIAWCVPEKISNFWLPNNSPTPPPPSGQRADNRRSLVPRWWRFSFGTSVTHLTFITTICWPWIGGLLFIFYQIVWKWIIWNRITCILHVQLDKSRQMELLISWLTRCRLTWILASIQIRWKLNIWTLVQCFRPVAWPDWRRWLAAPSGGSKRCPLNSIINPPSVRIPREQAAKLSDGGPQEGRWHHVKLIGEIKIHYTGSADWHLIGGGRSRDSVQPAENKHWTFERERGTEMSSVLSDGWCHRFDVATGQVNGTSADNKRNVRSNACHVMSHDTCQLIKWKKGQTWEVKFSLDPFFMRASFSGK